MRAPPAAGELGILWGPPARRGAVALVGAGPGDPGLVSLRAARLLSTATFVAYDRLAPDAPRALCADDCEQVDVGKLPDRHKLTQDEINVLLVERARRGDAVVRWKGGDPFVLGRGSEEAQACTTAGVDVEVVPGVTSAIAAPAYAGIPVTHRGLAPGFAVVTGHEDPTKPGTQVDHHALATFPGTLLLLMGVARIRSIAQALMDAGKDPSTPVALVRWGTTPSQSTLVADLAGVADAVDAVGFTSPAVTVIGDVVRLRDEIAWFEHPGLERLLRRRPLHGRRVVVPRTRHQAGRLSAELRRLGADPVEAPTIRLEPSRQPDRLDAALDRVAAGDVDWLLLTSVNAVDAVFARVDARGADARLFARVRLGVVGDATATSLSARGLRADLVPARSTSTDLAHALRDAHPSGSAVAPRADIATPALVSILREVGWSVDEVEAYRTVAADVLDPEVADDLRAGRVDAIAFPSSSTARNMVALLGGPPPRSVAVVSIGPSTSATCRELGLDVAAEAAPHDVDGLAAAVVAALVPGRGADPSLVTR